MELNRGFAFYENYWSSIQALPLEQQKEVCYAIVKYGITGEMVDPAIMPIGYTMTQSIHQAIDNSVSRWENNVQNNVQRKESSMEKKYTIEDLVAAGYNSREIADKLGLDPSTVRRAPAWKNRKERMRAAVEGDKDLVIEDPLIDPPSGVILSDAASMF